MAVGLAILTAYGSTTIDRLYDEVYATPDAYLQFIPEALRDRPLRDPLVVEALEDVGVARGGLDHGRAVRGRRRGDRRGDPAGPALGGPRRSRTRMLDGASAASGATEGTAAEGSDADGLDPAEPGLAL